ncbi:endonuclease [Pelagibacterium halotolerans]|uniref:endonuclease n=1 Tax=Pelagibacterium halotolerans TaxID=531813 RepID=UPI003850FE51
MQRDRNARHDRKRPNSSQRGYDGAFEREAKAFLAQPENQWCACGAPATVVMHVISIRKRPDLRMTKSNWRPGCKRCNAIDAVAERRT